MNLNNLLIRYNDVKSYLPSAIAIISLLLIGQFISPGFASMTNIGNIITVSSFLALVAVAQNMVIISGNMGIDLSIGSLVTMGALLGPSLTAGSDKRILFAIIILALLSGTFGLVNGIGIRIIGINALVMTLIIDRVANGFIFAVTRGQPSFNVPDALLAVGNSVFGPVRIILLITIVFLIVMSIVMSKTNFGRKIYLTGCNKNAAYLSGINVKMTSILVYVCSSIIACMTGFLLVGYVGSGQLKMGNEYTLLSVAAVVVGGTKLSGGKGTILGGTLGAIVLIILTNILVAVGLTAGVRQLIQGLTLLLILVINYRSYK